MNEKLKKQVKTLLFKYLVTPNYCSVFKVVAFVHFHLTLELAQGFIGLENYKNAHPDQIEDIDLSICFGHDLNGIIRREECFLPRCSVYQKFYK